MENDVNRSKRDYNTISPSAKTLLLLKGYTNIPFAREAAALLIAPQEYIPDFTKKDFGFWARVLHFENRYWSINQLLSDVPAKNILELSSGFSFRGLQFMQQKGFHYIDTDLPDLIETKKEFVAALQPDIKEPGSILEVLPLNALDEQQFNETVNRFPEGEIAIVNEGLLMYLDMEEKEQLCRMIHRTLKERGGCWITADVYLKERHGNARLKINDRLNDFFEQHQIREKMFNSFEEAEAFFKKNGFEVEKEANIDHAELSALPYFLRSASPEQLERSKVLEEYNRPGG